MENIILKYIEVRYMEKTLGEKKKNFLDIKNKISEYEFEIEKILEEVNDIEDIYYNQVYKKITLKESVWYFVYTMITLAIGFPFISSMSNKMFLGYTILFLLGFLLRKVYDNKTGDKRISLMYYGKIDSDIEYHELKRLLDLKNDELDKLVSECYDIKNEIEVIKENIINMKRELDLMLSDVKIDRNEHVIDQVKKRVKKIGDR